MKGLGIVVCVLVSCSTVNAALVLDFYNGGVPISEIDVAPGQMFTLGVWVSSSPTEDFAGYLLDFKESHDDIGLVSWADVTGWPLPDGNPSTSVSNWTPTAVFTDRIHLGNLTCQAPALDGSYLLTASGPTGVPSLITLANPDEDIVPTFHDVTVNVPEPATMGMVALGLITLAARRRNRR